MKLDIAAAVANGAVAGFGSWLIASPLVAAYVPHLSADSPRVAVATTLFFGGASATLGGIVGGLIGYRVGRRRRKPNP